MARTKQAIARLTIIPLGVAALWIVIALSCSDVVPKRAITPSAMTETSVRIEMYYTRNKRLPPDLNVLPVRKGYANRTTDAWGRPLIYVVNGDDSFTLSSLGADGAPGGSADNADLHRKYRVERGAVRQVP